MLVLSRAIPVGMCICIGLWVVGEHVWRLGWRSVRTQTYLFFANLPLFRRFCVIKARWRNLHTQFCASRTHKKEFHVPESRSQFRINHSIQTAITRFLSLPKNFVSSKVRELWKWGRGISCQNESVSIWGSALAAIPKQET